MGTNATWVCWVKENVALRATRTIENKIEVEIYDADEAFGLFVELDKVQATAFCRALLTKVEEVLSIEKVETALEEEETHE